jgi:hypothetical protein
MRMFARITDPILKSTQAITPNFLIDRLKPLYIAWLLFILRFYILPIGLGYIITGILSLPLEGGIADLFDDFWGAIR